MGTKLADQDKKFWANSILWRLGVALELIKEGERVAQIDPDEVLEMAEEAIWRYKSLEY